MVASGTAVTLGAGGLTINNGATYAMGDSTKIPAASTVHLNGGTWESQVGGSGSNSLFNAAAKIIIGSGGGTLFASTAAANFSLYQPSTGNGISGTGPVTFKGNNTGVRFGTTPFTYVGAYHDQPATPRAHSNSGRTPARRTCCLPPLTFTVSSGGVFNLGLSNAQVASLSGNSTGKVAYGGANLLLTINGSTNSTFSGVIQDSFTTYNPLVGSGGFKSRKRALPATLTLNGVNTMTGVFTMTAGGVVVGSTGSLCGGDLAANGGTITLNNTTQTVKTLTGTSGTISMGTGNTLISSATTCA